MGSCAPNRGRDIGIPDLVTRVSIQGRNFAHVKALGRWRARSENADETAMRATHTTFGAILALLALLPCSGCESVPALRASTAWQGSTPIRASYMWGNLETELPPGVRLESALIAARYELERQGHLIDEWSVTPQGGRFIAKSPPDSTYSRVHVHGSMQPNGGIGLTINIDPDSEYRTRQVLDAVLAAIGV